jgi:hypothetical protein
VTARTAADPAGRPGEAEYVAGISTDPQRPGWIRLCPIATQGPGEDDRFPPYDIVTVEALPVRNDHRLESWRPVLRTARTEHHLKQWMPRRRWLDPLVEESMCRLDRDTRDRTDAPRLALVRPLGGVELALSPHPGWLPSPPPRPDPYGERPEPGEPSANGSWAAPRFRGAYRYRCAEHGCSGHRQEILDAEFVALQRRLDGLPDVRLRQALENNYLRRMCGADRDFAFYVGSRDRPAYGFGVLGVYWPPRR